MVRKRTFKSPIESMLRDAIIQQCKLTTQDMTLSDRTLCTTPAIVQLKNDRYFSTEHNIDEEKDVYDIVGDGSWFAYLYRSVFVKTYRLDFLLVLDGLDVALAIECDGHEWHERTKQQASSDRARDRALLKLGIPTVRFTGSDIHHDADACASECLEVAKALADRSWFAGYMHGTHKGREQESRRQQKTELDGFIASAIGGLA